MRKWHFIGLPVLLVCFLVGAVLFLQIRVSSISRENRALRQAVDSLARSPQAQPALPGVNFRELEQYGFDSSSQFKALLFSSLKKRTDLIPFEGVLGGRMYFPSIELFWVLVDPWALAYFEDGHRAGYLLLKYQFKSPSDISWKVLQAQLK